MIEEYFSKLFIASSLNGSLLERESVKQVSKSENLGLIEEVTDAELKEEVFYMHPYKASDPNVLNPEFFQSFWSVVVQDVVLFC